MGVFDLALIIQLFILINPLSSFPVLLAAHKNKINVRKVAVNAVFIAFIIAIIVLIIGPYLFSLFRITVDSFRIAGGIVLLLLGIDKVRPKENDRKDVKEADALTSIIATPLLTGPAIISFIILQAIDIGKIPLFFNLLFAFIAVGIVFVMFAFTISRINAKIIDITSRVFGLFLTAVAIQMIAKGIMGVMAGVG